MPQASLRVLLFAGLRERAGWGERSVALATEGSTTPTDLWNLLALGGSAIPSTIRVAVNQRFVAVDLPLTPGDEVAFLPPISGG